MKNLFKFIFSRLFLLQLSIAIVIIVLLFTATIIGLRIHTRHNQTIQVPDLKGYNEAQIARVISSNEMRYAIIDSVYSKEVDPGTVFDQIPKAGAFVKKDRKVYLVMNAKNSEMVAIPSMKNVSLRQAKVMIKQGGLTLGEIVYVASEYRDLVLNQLMADTIAKPGTMVPKWSEISLQVGRGLGDSKSSVPYLRGMYWIDAKPLIIEMHLNEGVIIEDQSVDKHKKDSAIVWKQYPQPGVGVQYGKSVDVWLTNDSAVVYAADTTLRNIYTY